MVSAVAPLRVRRFRAIWITSVFSNIGSFLQTVAASWLMLELTGSATWVGFMQATNMLPMLFLALAAGAMADMVDRTKLMIAAQVVMGVAAGGMAVLTALGLISAPLLLILGLLLGTGLAINLPAAQALIPSLVPRGMLASAVALNSAGFNVARAVGPALGGFLVATAGAAVSFGLNALSFVGVVVVLTLVGRRLSLPEPEHTSLSSAIGLGIRFTRFTPAFRRLLLLLALFALTSAVVQTTLPSRTTELGGGAGTYGLLLGAMGAGALVGAFSRAQVMDRLAGASVPVTVGLFGVAGIIAGLAPSVVVAVPALMLAGACWVWTLVTLNVTTQTLIPEWIRGRAMSIHLVSFQGLFPFGAIIAGFMADAFGAGAATVILSVATVALGVVAPFFRIPALADIEAPEFDRDLTAPEHVETLEGGPVMILNTWVIDEADYDEFLEVLSRVRLVRLRTGSYRWRLYRNASDPGRLTEVFLTTSWEEHLAQHRRIDDSSAALLRRAREFDRADGPRTTHLVAIDLERPPDWDDLLISHRELHRVDGSIPLDEDLPSGVPTPHL